MEATNTEPSAAETPAAPANQPESTTTAAPAAAEEEPKQEPTEESSEPSAATDGETPVSTPAKEEDELPKKREAAEIDEPEAKKQRASTADENESSGALRRSGRERKAVHREGFVAEEGEEAKEAASPEAGGGGVESIEKGRGVCLKDIPTFVENFDNLKSSSPASRKLYKALFKVVGRPANRREHILEWSGLPEGKPADELTNDIAKACTLADLREIGKKLLGQTIESGVKETKQAWIEIIVSILTDPQEDSVLPAAVDVTSKAGKAGAPAFQLFCAERKPALQSEHPEASHRELMRLLGVEWRALSDQEKQKYVQTGLTKNGPSSGGLRRRPPAKGRKSRKQDSSDEEPPLEDDDDEEVDEEEQDAAEDGTA